MQVLLASAFLFYLPIAASGDEDDAVSLADATLSINDAILIALNQVPGSVVESALERADGLVIWEVVVVDAVGEVVEFVIDANSGEILEQEKND